MDFVSGEDLGTTVRRLRQPLPVPQVLQIAEQPAICVQLAYEATFVTWTPDHMFQRGTALAASLPIVVYAMWRFRLFVKGAAGKPPY